MVRHSKAVILALVAVALLCDFGFAQREQEELRARQRAREEKAFLTAANRWMRDAVDVRNQKDPVSSAYRQIRDDYWDQKIGASVPLTEPEAMARPLPHGDAALDSPEFGDLADGVIVIGRFESRRVILSASLHSVYTEIQFRVQHVFGHPNSPIREGELIDICRPGGTIIAPWGSTVSFGLHPEQWSLQPNRVYLIHLGYAPSGDFYVGGDRTTSSVWDLTDGTVKPGNALQKARAEEGFSEINGLSVGSLVDLLNRKFANYYAGGR